MEHVQTFFYIHCRIGEHEVCVEISQGSERLTRSPPGLDRKQRELLCEYVVAQDTLAMDAGKVRQERIPALSPRLLNGATPREDYHNYLGELPPPDWMK